MSERETQYTTKRATSYLIPNASEQWKMADVVVQAINVAAYLERMADERRASDPAAWLSLWCVAGETYQSLQELQELLETPLGGDRRHEEPHA